MTADPFNQPERLDNLIEAPPEIVTSNPSTNNTVSNSSKNSASEVPAAPQPTATMKVRCYGVLTNLLVGSLIECPLT
jgi:hypothetical protein